MFRSLATFARSGQLGHIRVELDLQDWQTVGFDIPILLNMQPAGKYLGESFHRAGGVPAVIGELLKAGLLHENATTVTGKTIAENHEGWESRDVDVIKTVAEPMREQAGFLVLSGSWTRADALSLQPPIKRRGMYCHVTTTDAGRVNRS